jgi:pimeloyl-ACP methyl ester carboxylesterase
MPLLCALACLVGCHSVHPPPRELIEPCQSLPRCCRDHVHIFLIDGLDPANCADLPGLRSYLVGLGFNNTSHGQLYHTGTFLNTIRRIHAEDRSARFVLVGFSFGANAARHVANQLKEEQVEVDLLVYLGGNTLGNTPRDRPSNARRVVNILATGWIWHGAQMDDADNLSVPDVLHFGSPTHQATLEMFARELAEVAAQVPLVINTADTTTSSKLQPAWSFLAPAESLQPLPEREHPSRSASRAKTPGPAALARSQR